MFSSEEIDQFVHDGYVMFRGGFSREVADAVRESLWAKSGVARDDPSSWSQSIIHIQEAFRGPPFDQILNSRIVSAVGELAGHDRAYVHDFFGWWPILFPGFDGPGGWHIDGSNFRHRLTSQEQALVTLYLFSDIEVGGGGTAIVPGSHHTVARILEAAEPEGLALEELIARLPSVDPESVIEVAGRAGDIAFLHPFVVHGFGANRSSSVRIACNPQYPFKEAMNLNREDGDHSPVEEAIRIAIKRPTPT